MRLLALLLLVSSAAALTSACGEGDGMRRVSRDRAPTPAEEHPGEPDGCVVDGHGTPLRHRVRTGETLSAIARRYYGDAGLWPEIARENASLVGENGAVKAGDELVIPFAGR